MNRCSSQYPASGLGLNTITVRQPFSIPSRSGKSSGRTGAWAVQIACSAGSLRRSLAGNSSLTSSRNDFVNVGSPQHASARMNPPSSTYFWRICFWIWVSLSGPWPLM